MGLSHSLLEDVEEFLELISNEDECGELEHAIESLRNFLQEEADGWTHQTKDKLAYAVQSRIEEIWGLISEFEKRDNSNLEDYCQALLRRLEKISGYEADEIEVDRSYDEG